MLAKKANNQLVKIL